MQNNEYVKDVNGGSDKYHTYREISEWKPEKQNQYMRAHPSIHGLRPYGKPVKVKVNVRQPLFFPSPEYKDPQTGITRFLNDERGTLFRFSCLG